MKRTLLSGIAVLLLITGAAHAQEDNLILTCEGKEYLSQYSVTTPIIISIIVDFTKNEVHGFETDLRGETKSAKIVKARTTETSIYFETYNKLFDLGDNKVLPDSWEQVRGEIDRLSGEMWVDAIWQPMASSIRQTTYFLKCKPTQRIF
jgi:hypothetical protein